MTQSNIQDLLKNKSKEELIELAKALDELENKKRVDKLGEFFPAKGPLAWYNYPKHIEFINSTATADLSVFMAANRVGKSETAAYFVACAALNRYPNWWTGKRWNKPLHILCAGDIATRTRDILQLKLIGQQFNEGTGFIPAESIVKVNYVSNPSGAADRAFIKTDTGQTTVIYFASYNQGFEAIRGLTLDLVWVDEECPLDFLVEASMRTMTTKGKVLVTFTPDKNITETVMHFLDDGILTPGLRNGKYLVNVGIDEAPHIDEETRARMRREVPPHIASAKLKGIPAVGEGAIYPIDIEKLLIEPFEIPAYWPRCYGLDLGWNHPTAAAWVALDRDTDTVYIYDTYKARKAPAHEHAERIAARGKWIPGACDTSIMQSNPIDGKIMINIYRQAGLNLHLADKTVESGIAAIYQRMVSGKLKIFRHLQDIQFEIRMYRRDDKGRIVKTGDDLLDAFRYAINTGLYIAKSELEYNYEDDTVVDFKRNKITGY